MQNKIIAVIDTNVLVSTLYSKNGLSNPAIVINAIIDGIIIPMFNEEILSEYEQVLKRDHFNFPPNLVHDLLQLFRDTGINAERITVDDEYFPDPGDRVFYEVRMNVQDSYLVTGNSKHFPQKHFIVSPKQMVDILREKNLIQ